jgi:hypothetical protein
VSDDHVLALLGDALAPGDREPPPDRTAALRVRVAARAAASPPISIERGSALHRQRWFIATAVAAAIAIAFGCGAVLADVMPRPVRAAAHALGLPVDSPQLRDARDELHQLGLALAAGDLDGIERADAEMVRLVRSLDPDEQAEIQPVAHEVHLRAVQVLTDAGRPPP